MSSMSSTARCRLVGVLGAGLALAREEKAWWARAFARVLGCGLVVVLVGGWVVLGVVGLLVGVVVVVVGAAGVLLAAWVWLVSPQLVARGSAARQRRLVSSARRRRGVVLVLVIAWACVLGEVWVVGVGGVGAPRVGCAGYPSLYGVAVLCVLGDFECLFSVAFEWFGGEVGRSIRLRWRRP